MEHFGNPSNGTSLKRRLVGSLLAGTVAFLFVTTAIRSIVEDKSTDLEGSIHAQLGAQNGLFEVERQVGRLEDRIVLWREGVMRTTGPNPALADFWESVQTLSEVRPEETLALVSSTGEIGAASGPLAADIPAFQMLLRSRALVGRTGPSGVRAGMLSPGPDTALAVSIPIYDVGSSTGSTGMPGLSPRLAIVGPFEARDGSMRDGRAVLSLFPLHGDGLPEEYRTIPSKLWRKDGVHDDGPVSYRAIDDPSGRPTFLLVSRVSAQPAGFLSAFTRESLIWEALAALVTGLLAMRFMGRNVVEPLDSMHRHASRLARSEHGRLEFHSSESGEIGALARALDEMLHKIQADRSEFVRSARIAGMSDVSMGVVHSAGNILNSVNVSTKLLAKELGEIGISDLRGMIAELKEHKDDLATYVTEDPNGKFLLPFLSATTEALDDLRTRCLVELESVEHGVGHVIHLIRSQEKYAIGAAVVEVTTISDVVDQALNIVTLADDNSAEIHIEKSYAKLREVHIDRHRLTSILINIISNAIEALSHAEVSERRLELAIYPMTDDRFVIEVMDTGIGIAPEHLNVIFTSSFTTKTDSPGQGLHTTANLCKEMGIAIGTVSEGPGCGSVFKLRVPYEPPMGLTEAVEPADEAPLDVPVEDPEPALPAEGQDPIEQERSWSTHTERGDLYRDSSYRDRKLF